MTAPTSPSATTFSGKRRLTPERLLEVISWAETNVGAFDKFPVSEKSAADSYLWMLCLAILDLRDDVQEFDTVFANPSHERKPDDDWLIRQADAILESVGKLCGRQLSGMMTAQYISEWRDEYRKRDNPPTEERKTCCWVCAQPDKCKAEKLCMFAPDTVSTLAFNAPLMWLYTHCRAIGMTSKSDSGLPEHDIALFTAELKSAASATASSGKSFSEMFDHAKQIARYRWLRDGPIEADGLHRADIIFMQHHHGEALDKAIDAAIEASDRTNQKV